MSEVGSRSAMQVVAIRHAIFQLSSSDEAQVRDGGSEIHRMGLGTLTLLLRLFYCEAEGEARRETLREWMSGVAGCLIGVPATYAVARVLGPAFVRNSALLIPLFGILGWYLYSRPLRQRRLQQERRMLFGPEVDSWPLDAARVSGALASSNDTKILPLLVQARMSRFCPLRTSAAFARLLPLLGEGDQSLFTDGQRDFLYNKMLANYVVNQHRTFDYEVELIRAAQRMRDPTAAPAIRRLTHLFPRRYEPLRKAAREYLAAMKDWHKSGTASV